MDLKLDKGIYSHGLVLMNCLIGILISFTYRNYFDLFIFPIIVILTLIYILYILKTNSYVITAKIYGIVLGVFYGFYLIVISTFGFSLENIFTLIFLYVLVILILGSSIYTIVKWRAINILLEWILMYEFIYCLTMLQHTVTNRILILFIFTSISLIANTAYLIILYIYKRLKKN